MPELQEKVNWGSCISISRCQHCRCTAWCQHVKTCILHIFCTLSSSVHWTHGKSNLKTLVKNQVNCQFLKKMWPSAKTIHCLSLFIRIIAWQVYCCKSFLFPCQITECYQTRWLSTFNLTSSNTKCRQAVIVWLHGSLFKCSEFSKKPLQENKQIVKTLRQPPQSGTPQLTFANWLTILRGWSCNASQVC